MRRAMAVLVSVATIVGMVAEPVFADSGPTRTVSGLTVRADPNEKKIPRVDIRRVITHLGTDEVLLRVGIWRKGGFAHSDVQFFLDSTGTSDIDYVVEITTGECDVETVGIIGHVAERHAGPRDVLCRIPRRLLTIDKQVRFYVEGFGEKVDRAPNRGSYLGF